MRNRDFMHMKFRNKKNVITFLLFTTLLFLGACGNNQKHESSSIVGYWERISGGDHDPNVCMILNFQEDNQLEKIVLYSYGGENYVNGYIENCGPYNLNGDKLFVWGKNQTISFSENKFFIDDMVFERISEEEMKKRCKDVKGLTSKNSSSSESEALMQLKELVNHLDNKMKEVVMYKDKEDENYAQELAESFIQASEIVDSIKYLEGRISDSEYDEFGKYIEDRKQKDPDFDYRLNLYQTMVEKAKEIYRK